MLRQRDVYSRIYVSPREIEQCFAKRKNSPGDDVEYELAHILVSVPTSATPEQAEARVARAQGVYERARRGEDFSQLAISYSDAGTALEGGSIGWRKASQLPSFAADAIPQLKPGEVTEPIRTPSGLHLFKLINARGVTGSASGVAGPCAPHPARDQRGRGRRRGQAEAHQFPQPHPQGRELRSHRRGQLRRLRLGGEGRRPRLGRARHLRAGVRAEARRTARKTRSASLSRRSSAGTSCNCSAAAPTTRPTT